MDEAWRVDWANECVWHGRERVRLPPKVFAVLRLLAADTGQLVTKEALLQTVWPDTVVSEGVLTTCIGELRKALGETAQAPRFVRTVHRRGYRFIGTFPRVPPRPRPPTAARRARGRVGPAPAVAGTRAAGRTAGGVAHRRAGDRQNDGGARVCGGGRGGGGRVAGTGAVHRPLRRR